MKAAQILPILALALLLMVSTATVSEAAPMGTAFTYQGRLIDANEAADGLYDFQFKLYDAELGGNQKGDDVNKPETDVIDGYFTVMLDVNDPCAFDGEAGWLEIGVRPGDLNDTNAYTVLTPRQQLTPAPHALALPGLWTKQNGTSPNIIGGYSGNVVANGVYGATIGGGGKANLPNKVTAVLATVGGGFNNTASGDAATMGGGFNNTASDDAATVGGGSGNTASGNFAVVGGGDRNTASDGATVGGGAQNTASGVGATVGGGNQNTASGDAATVGGGRDNDASHDYATVGGGRDNDANDHYATVGGGSYNTAIYDYATVGGGNQNTASDLYATVGGGTQNTARGAIATVSGGQNNTASHDGATVGGGVGNTASGMSATIGGGFFNSVGNGSDTVGGGQFNIASGMGATVAGGAANTAGDHVATVGGGLDNTASGSQTTVGGGSDNTASGGNAAVGGGWGNTASGYSATVPGGRDNTAAGDYSFAAGRRAKANHNGSFVWADSTDANFASTANDQFLIRASGGVGVGVNDPCVALDVDGTARLRGISAGIGTAVVADANGTLWKQVPSSRRYKTNIQDLETDPDAVLKLRAVSFQYKSSGQQDIGLIAEEVEPLARDLVIYDDQGRPDAVKYDRVSLYLLAVVKELKAENESLTKQLESESLLLRKRLAALERTIQQHELAEVK
jgi:hypothetical protein